VVCHSIWMLAINKQGMQLLCSGFVMLSSQLLIGSLYPFGKVPERLHARVSREQEMTALTSEHPEKLCSLIQKSWACQPQDHPKVLGHLQDSRGDSSQSLCT
jgi:hypothetical protein